MPADTAGDYLDQYADLESATIADIDRLYELSGWLQHHNYLDNPPRSMTMPIRVLEKIIQLDPNEEYAYESIAILLFSTWVDGNRTPVSDIPISPAYVKEYPKRAFLILAEGMVKNWDSPTYPLMAAKTCHPYVLHHFKEYRVFVQNMFQLSFVNSETDAQQAFVAHQFAHYYLQVENNRRLAAYWFRVSVQTGKLKDKYSLDAWIKLKSFKEA